MPERPLMLDEISDKMKGATVKDIVVPSCCFSRCIKHAEYLLALRFKDGSTNLYGLCKDDMLKLRNQHPSTLERTMKQGVFLYP